MLDTVVPLAALAFVREFAAATLGMGNGTTLAPILIIVGYEPLALVPAILASQLIAGFVIAAFLHRFRNMDLLNSGHGREALLIFAAVGMGGVLVATYMNISLPSSAVKFYIAGTVVVMGLIMLLCNGHEYSYSHRKLGFVGSVAAFCRGISRGGYGPLSTGVQIVSGIQPRAGIAITALIEGFICAVRIAVYLLLLGPPEPVLTLSMTLGAVVGAPFSALTTATSISGFSRRLWRCRLFSLEQLHWPGCFLQLDHN